MHRTQIALCYGTRPQVIKASVVRSRLEPRYSVVAVDTGQHNDAAGIEPRFRPGLQRVVSAAEPLVR
jgi:UDP-N-acetylglucosamine 2-epimerase